MKTSRDQLKELMKELLIEILSEGLGNVSPPVRGQFQQARPSLAGTVTERSDRRPRRGLPPFDKNLDTPVSRYQGSSAMQAAIKESAGGNPMLASIFADTAATTLPSMLSHGDSGPSGGSLVPHTQQQEQFTGTPEQVFGDSSSRWADLAFTDLKKKTA